VRPPLPASASLSLVPASVSLSLVPASVSLSLVPVSVSLSLDPVSVSLSLVSVSVAALASMSRPSFSAPLSWELIIGEPSPPQPASPNDAGQETTKANADVKTSCLLMAIAHATAVPHVR
jgi:hypothetical protein